MKIIGLTGGVGMGKSTAARLLRAAGVQVVDTDELARQLVQPGQPALDEIRRAFGERFIDPDGRLRREELADVIFADATARRRLEDILHPRIHAMWQAQVESWRKEGEPLAVVVIPLLFETGAEKELDSIVCVACTGKTQRQRLLERGWSEEQIVQRINAQWPIEEKMALADYVVWTESSLEVHEQQLRRIIRLG